MFKQLKSAAKDPILSLSFAYQQDTHAQKLNLGIGVYRDEQGMTPVLASVKIAEKYLLENQQSKAYVGLAGCEQFNAEMINLVLGDNSSRSRAVGVQTPGASGALRLLADVIKLANPTAKIWMSDLSYANHAPIMQTAGLEVGYYPYFDPETKKVNEAAMLSTLSQLDENDVVLLHGCCHNPTGADISFTAWQAIAEMAIQSGFLPFIDIAYQGFGEGMQEDAAGFRYLAEHVPAYIAASSCSKNFGLYRERTGLAIVASNTLAESECIKGRIIECARSTYTMPPDHGAAIVRHILQDTALTTQWLSEVTEMRTRILNVRSLLVDALKEQTGTQQFDFINQHKGMFSVIGTNEEQLIRLREEFGIYIVGGGRINIAGLRETEVPYLAESLSTVFK